MNERKPENEDYLRLDDINGYVSSKLKICPRCCHEDSSHVTFDMRNFKCLEKGCECKFRED